MRAAIFVLCLLVVSNFATWQVAMKNARPKGHTVESVTQSLQDANGVVIFGDSIVEDAKFPSEVCELPVLNAGIGGAGAATFIPIVQKLRTTPKLIVVSVGINDRGNNHFTESYSMLIDSMPKTKLALVLLPQHGSDQINLEIRSLAESRRAALIDTTNIEDFRTVDGIHPTGQSYRDWREKVMADIQILTCDN